MGWLSVSKGACSQTWLPEFDSQSPYGGWRDTSKLPCALWLLYVYHGIHMCTWTHARTHACKHTQINEWRKEMLFRAYWTVLLECPVSLLLYCPNWATKQRLFTHKVSIFFSSQHYRIIIARFQLLAPPEVVNFLETGNRTTVTSGGKEGRVGSLLFSVRNLSLEWWNIVGDGLGQPHNIINVLTDLHI